MYITAVTWANDTPTEEVNESITATVAVRDGNTPATNFVSRTAARDGTAYTVSRRWPSEQHAQDWIDYVLQYSPVTTSIHLES